MQGPFQIQVSVLLSDGKQHATATIGLPFATMINWAMLQEALRQAEKNLRAAGGPDWKLMDRREYLRHLVMAGTGGAAEPAPDACPEAWDAPAEPVRGLAAPQLPWADRERLERLRVRFQSLPGVETPPEGSPWKLSGPDRDVIARALDLLSRGQVAF